MARLLTPAVAHERHGGVSVGGEEEDGVGREEKEEEDPRRRRRRESAGLPSACRPRSSSHPRRRVGSARLAGLLVGARYAPTHPASSSAPGPRPSPLTATSRRSGGALLRTGVAASPNVAASPAWRLGRRRVGGAPVVEMGTGPAEEKDEGGC
jgi:hypothetical protein